jgi:hypothetical protein
MLFKISVKETINTPPIIVSTEESIAILIGSAAVAKYIIRLIISLFKA